LKNGRFFCLISIIFCSIVLSYDSISAETGPIRKGVQFPHVVFRDILSNEERSYLGLSRKTNFSFKDFTGTLFITEVFSTYCMSCPKNVPILNDVYSAVRNNPKLRGMIKVIAIAAGNNINEVRNFRKEYNVLYPVLSDPEFTTHKALGNPRVPYTVFIKKTTEGDVVIFTHQGLLDSAEEVLRKAVDYLPE
jgi:thiol-disulfide isomerase/thioredoxin